MSSEVHPIYPSTTIKEEEEKVKRKVLASLLVIAVVAGLVGASTWAFFSDINVRTVNTTNATVKVGEIGGFPLNFDNLTPGMWTEWQGVGLRNLSSIPVDLYLGLQDKGIGGCDLIDPDVLLVQIQWSDGSSWETRYNAGGAPLFSEWQKVWTDWPASDHHSYRVRVALIEDAGNEYQGCETHAWMLIYAVQHNGPVPDSAPWDYTLL